MYIKSIKLFVCVATLLNQIVGNLHVIRIKVESLLICCKGVAQIAFYGESIRQTQWI